jgi:hypothetical protein
MPTLTFDIAAAATRAKTSDTILLQEHMLYSVAVISLTTGIRPQNAWVELGLMVGGTDVSQKFVILSSDYCGQGKPAGWHGKLPILPDTYLYCDIFANSAATYRINAYLFKLILTSDGRQIVDP